MVASLREFVEDQVMIHSVVISFHHHPVGLPNNIPPHGAVSPDVRRSPVEAKSIFGTVVNPVLLQQHLCLTFHLNLYSTAVVLDHTITGSADVVQFSMWFISRTESDAGAVVTQSVPDKRVTDTLGKHRSCPFIKILTIFMNIAVKCIS